jgi:hypothetical protein
MRAFETNIMFGLPPGARAVGWARLRASKSGRTDRVAKVFCSMCTVCSEITLVAGMSTPVL